MLFVFAGGAETIVPGGSHLGQRSLETRRLENLGAPAGEKSLQNVVFSNRSVFFFCCVTGRVSHGAKSITKRGDLQRRRTSECSRLARRCFFLAPRGPWGGPWGPCRISGWASGRLIERRLDPKFWSLSVQCRRTVPKIRNFRVFENIRKTWFDVGAKFDHIVVDVLSQN